VFLPLAGGREYRRTIAAVTARTANRFQKKKRKQVFLEKSATSRLIGLITSAIRTVVLA